MNEIYYMTATEPDRQLPVYLTGVGHWDHQLGIERPEGFPEHQWSQVLAGEGELRIGTERMRIKAGEGFYLPPGLEHGYEAVREPWEVRWFTFDGRYADSLVELAGLKRPGPHRPERPELLLPGLDALLELGRRRGPGAGSESSKLIYGLLLDLRQLVSETGAASLQQNERLEPVLRHIGEHLHLPISLDELARLIHVTPQHLCLLFKKTYRLRPMEYVNRERINRSKELLRIRPDAKLHEIAVETGFPSPGYFNTLFKRYTGLTPGEFRSRRGV